MEEEIAESYRSSLSDLTVNSKPLINMLTMLAEDNEQYAGTVVQVIEEYLHQAASNRKLPVLYLIDSIVKNLPRSTYPSQFSHNIVKTFCDMFNEVDEKTRQSMYKLRLTWEPIFTDKLYELDTRVRRIDPAWPVTAESPVAEKRKIHVNPKFLKQKPEDSEESAFSPDATPPHVAEEAAASVDADLEAKKQQLQRLELELKLAEAKARLDGKKAELELKNQMKAAPPQAMPTLAPTPATTATSKTASRDPRLASRDPRRARQMAAPASAQPDTTQGSPVDFLTGVPRPGVDSPFASLAQPFPQQTELFPSTTALQSQTGTQPSYAPDPAVTPFPYQQPYMTSPFQPLMSTMMPQTQVDYMTGQPYPIVPDAPYQTTVEGSYNQGLPSSQQSVSYGAGAQYQQPPLLRQPASKPSMERPRGPSLVDPRSSRAASTPRMGAKKARSPSPKPRSIPNKARPTSSTSVPPPAEVKAPSPKEKTPPPKEKTPPPKQEAAVVPKEKTPPPKSDESTPAVAKKSSPKSPRSAKGGGKKANAKEEKEVAPPQPQEKENVLIRMTCPPSSPDAGSKGKEDDSSTEKPAESKETASKPTPEEKSKENKSKDVKSSTSSEKLSSKKNEKTKGKDAKPPSEKSRRDSSDTSEKKDSAENRSKHGDRKNEERSSARDRPWRIPRRTHRYDSDEDRGSRRPVRSGHRRSEERMDRESSRYSRGSRDDRRVPRRDRDRSPMDRREDRGKDSKPGCKASPLLADPKPSEVPMDVDERSNSEPTDVDERNKGKRQLPRKGPEEGESERKRPRVDSGSENSRDIEDLFGGEDVDYRSRRPPKTPAGNTGWGQYKAERPKEFSMEYVRQKSREINDFHEGPQDIDLRTITRPKPCLLPTPNYNGGRLEALPKGLNLENQEDILHGAQKLLQSGSISHEQHQEMLRQLDEVYAAKQYQEDRRMADPHGRPRGPLGTPMDVDHRRMMAPDEDLRRGRGRPLLDHPGDVDSRRMRRSPPQGREDSDMRHCSPRTDFAGSPRATFGDSDMRSPHPDMGKSGYRPDSHSQDMDMRGMGGPRSRYQHDGPIRNGPGVRLPPPNPHLGGPRIPEMRGPRGSMGRRQGVPFQHAVGEGTPMDDPRWSTMRNAFLTDAVEEVVIDGRPYEIILGGKARRIRFGKLNHFVYADPQKRAILIDDVPMYKFGEDIKDIQLDGHWHKIYYHGTPKVFWIDGQQHEVRIDAPPWNIILDDKPYGFQIDGRDMMILVDRRPIGHYGGSPRTISLKTGDYEIRFDHPPKHILVDGQSCELKLDRKIPILMYKGKPHAIRFDGPPKDIIIDGIRFTVRMDMPHKIRLGSRPHTLAFGGPCHEVIIDGKWYEVKFDQNPKDIMVGNRTHSVQLIGPVPSVKILDEVPIDFEEKMSKEQHRQAFDKARDFPDGPPQGQERQYSPEFMQQVTGPAMRFQGPPSQFPGSTGGFPNQGPMAGAPQQGLGPVGMAHGSQQGPMRMMGPQGPMQGAQAPIQGAQGPMQGPQGPIQGPQGPIQALQGPMQGLQGPLQGIPLQGMQNAMAGAMQGFGGMMPSSMGLGQPQLQNLFSTLPSMMNNLANLSTAGLPNLSTMVNLQNFQGVPGMQQSMAPMVPGVQMPPASAPMTAGVPPMQQQLPQQPQPQPQPQQQGAAAAAPVDVNSLLDKLLAAGLIQKPEKSTTATTEAETPATTKTEAAPAQSVSAVLQQLQQQVPKQATPKKEALEKIPDMTDFATDKLKKFNKGVIQRLYQGIQCSSCGSRFSVADQSTTKYREHLDWHFRQNRKEKEEVKVSKFRKWFYEIREWYVYEELEDHTEKGRSQIFDQMLHGMPNENNLFAGVDPQRTDIIKCPKAGEGDDNCVICGDPFEQFWVDDAEGWQLRDAVQVGGKIYHPICYEDAADGSFQDATPTPTPTPSESPAVNPLAAALAEAQAITMGLSAPPKSPTSATSSSTPSSTASAPVTVKTEPGTSVQEQGAAALPLGTVKTEPVEPAHTEVPGSTPALIAPSDIKQERS